MSRQIYHIQPVRYHTTDTTLRALVAATNRMFDTSIALSTSDAYKTAWNSVLRFGEKFNIVITIPVSDELASMWATYMATRDTKEGGPVQHSTIKCYASGIASMHEQYGFPNWRNEKYIFDRVCKGIKRHLGESNKLLRRPITTALLELIRVNLDDSNYDHVLFWAAATMVSALVSGKM